MRNYLFNNKQYITKRYFSDRNFSNKIQNMTHDDHSMIGFNFILASIFGSSLYFDAKPKYTENEKVSRFMTGGIFTMCSTAALWRLIKVLK